MLREPHTTRRAGSLATSILTLAILTACGGGGGSSGNSTGSGSNTVALSITQQPADQSVQQGNTANFSVQAAGTGVTCQWQFSTDGGTTWTNITGATACSYAVTNATVALDGEQLRARVTDSAGTTVLSSAVRLSVSIGAASAPSISVQPAAVTVTAGQTANLSVTASGTPSPSYQWQVSVDGGATWSAVAGATAASYTTAVTSTADSGHRYRVVVTNSGGTVISDPAILTVNAAPAGGPTISTPPLAAVSVTAPAAASFSVVATGTAPLSYQWQVSSDNGSTWGNISGATGNTYTTAATSTADNGKRYRVVVSDAQGSATSSAAVLTVAAASSPPVITAAPAAASVTAPATATFSVTATGNPTPTYQWQLSTDGGSTWANITGATAASYTTPATATSDSGKQYRVVVTNSVGSASSNAVGLTVSTPVLTAVTKRLALTSDYLLMVKADGSVMSIGSGTYGGIGTPVNGSSAISVTGATGTKSVSATSAGAVSATNLLTKQDGTLMAWGGSNGFNGGLGRATMVSGSRSIVTSIQSPTNVTQLVNVAEARDVCGSTVARMNDGSVWLMASTAIASFEGSVDGYPTSLSINAAQVPGIASAKSLGDPATRYCDSLYPAQIPVVLNNGSLLMLAVTPASALSPTSPDALHMVWTATTSTSQVAGLPSVVQASCSSSLELINCLALTSAGTVYSWGTNNAYGQLGNGTVSSVVTPTQISGLADVIQVAASMFNGYAVTRQGAVYNWGQSIGLGNARINSYTFVENALTPVVFSSIGNVAEISVNESLHAARKTDGTVWVWGPGATLGRGSFDAYSGATQLTGINLN